MEGETSWVSHSLDDVVRDYGEFDSFSELSDEGCKEVSAVSVDLILPDDLLERIITYLPIASIFRVGCVCKRWNEIVSSRRFLWNFTHALSQKPWYYMFTSSDEPIGYAYDPILRKWYGIELPCIETSSWIIASSCGLVCFMDNESRTELYACNPITRHFRRLEEPPGLKFSDYSALAISVNKTSRFYSVSVVKSKQVPGNFFQWELSIHIYEAETMMWVTPLAEVLTGWRGGDESVICGGVLFFLIYSTGGGIPESRHGLITYNLSGRLSHGLLMRSFIPMPCPLTCGRLMNLKEKLVMVGGIGKQDRPGIIKGIGIWVLNGKEWEEIARMPHKFFQGFGEFDDVFASSGTDDLIYIQSYGAPALLVFDLNQKQWRWSQKCPVTKSVSVVKSKQVPGNFFQWELSIHIYEAETMMWVTPLAEVLTGWRGGDESVICGGVLFFLIYSTGGGIPESRHGLITYNLSGRLSHGLLMRSFIPMPCPLTCGRLMNLKEKLVMVGGIGKQDRPGIIKGIGIWVLNGKEWEEIARMPHKFFQGFGEFDDVFASSGTDDLIYIQSYGAPALLVFDLNQKQWRWSQKCPVTKRFPLQLFTGFSFEPRLEITP